MTQQKESLNPNKKSLAHFFGLHHLMGQNEIILVYSGEITQSQIKTLLAFTERKFSMVNMEDIVRRKIFNIMVEMLQNISKNAIDNTPEFSKFAPIFLIGETEEIFFLISNNKISNDKIEMLKNRIEKVNTLDAVGLKKLYKEVRLTGKFSEVSGAGIGIIDMARKSENKLTYDFTAIDDAHSMYSLQIDIHKNVNIKTK